MTVEESQATGGLSGDEAPDRTRTAARGASTPLRDALMQAPAAIAISRGPEHVIEFASDMYRRIFGRRDYVGRRARDVFPEIADQNFLGLMDRVYETGTPYAGTESPMLWDRDGNGERHEGF
ncbi:MAG TPA: PAS domain-containing protein, partial [Gemmatimonadaceae bacterium]